MRGFLRYACWYCLTRFAYDTMRAAARRPARPAQPCQRHGFGIVLGLIAWAALVPITGAALLCLLGLVVK